MGNVVSFFGALQSRAEDVAQRGRLNAGTVTLASGEHVAQRAIRITPSEMRLAEIYDTYAAVTHDAEGSGVPLRVAHEAWINCRAALVGAGVEAAGVIRYGAARGDCRNLLVASGDRYVGPFSILEGSQPRAVAAIQSDLQRLLAG